MVIAVTHSTVATLPDEAGAEVNKNEWNADHTLVGISGGTGAPDDLNGAEGDLYSRTDGGVLSTIYQKRSGVWVGIV